MSSTPPRPPAALFATFPPATPADWERCALASLKGRPLASLHGESEDGITLAPMYWAAQSDVLPHVHLTDPPAPAVGGDGLPAAWEIRQHPQARTVRELRTELTELAARGQRRLPVTLERQAPLEPGAFRALFDELDLGRAIIELEAGDRPALAWSLLRGLAAPHRLTTNWTSQALSTGRVGAGRAARELAELWRGEGARRAILWISGVDFHESGASPAQELALWLAAWTSSLRELESEGIDLDATLTRTRHELAADRELFDTMAKLRAARLLAARVLEAAACPEASRAIRLGACGARRTQTRHDPWTNLLRATLQGFAAGAGGADFIHLPSMAEGLGDSDALARRLAGNIHVILQEEAHLGRVRDPGRGSWYLESLTAALAEAAWRQFQELERAGGLWAAVEAGLPQEWVRAGRDRRLTRLSRRRETLVGTNLHPNLAEVLPEWARKATPVGDDANLLAPRRMALELETLRDRGRALVERQPEHAQVWLACCGPRHQHMARAEFCRGTLAVGGLPCVQGDGAADGDDAAALAFARKAPVVVLCSSDDSYPTLAPAFVEGLRRREQEGGRPPALILLAGHPAGQVEDLRAAGVQSFLHLKGGLCEMLEPILFHLEDHA